MHLNQIDRNLILFVDPMQRYKEQEWVFIDDVVKKRSEFLGKNVVFRFSRKKLLAYCFASVRLFMFNKTKSRKFIYINDHLFSSIFDVANTSAYRLFCKKHLPKLKTILQRIVAMMPLFLRAETRYIIEYYDISRSNINSYSEVSDLELCDIMFFSNADGKLLLMNSEILNIGFGHIIKTTANPDYVNIMSKEYNTAVGLSGKLSKVGIIPIVGKHLEVKGRHFFTEKYIVGKSLLEQLRVLAKRSDSIQICAVIDKLDEWFRDYRASFTDKAIAVSKLYTHLFPLFAQCYGRTVQNLLQTGVYLLKDFEKAYPVMTPIVAHNDLWPGNIIVTGNGFVVIDWERATENRAPFFDYFWMVISTAIEALAGLNGNIDYSKSFKIFLCQTDIVSCHALAKIKSFLNQLGIAEEYLPNLLFLFFMELSVQGFQIRNKKSDMDRLVFDVLNYYASIIEVGKNRIAYL